MYHYLTLVCFTDVDVSCSLGDCSFYVYFASKTFSSVETKFNDLCFGEYDGHFNISKITKKVESGFRFQDIHRLFKQLFLEV